MSSYLLVINVSSLLIFQNYWEHNIVFVMVGIVVIVSRKAGVFLLLINDIMKWIKTFQIYSSNQFCSFSFWPFYPILVVQVFILCELIYLYLLSKRYAFQKPKKATRSENKLQQYGKVVHQLVSWQILKVMENHLSKAIQAQVAEVN